MKYILTEREYQNARKGKDLKAINLVKILKKDIRKLFKKHNPLRWELNETPKVKAFLGDLYMCLNNVTKAQ